VVRQVLISFVDVSLDSVNELAVDLDFYASFTLKPLTARAEQWAGLLKLDGGSGGGDALVETWYPWNRTFEIGLALADNDDGGEALLGCDVVVAGGSTSALAAAIAAADELSQDGPTPGTVCLTEPTDWVGGQLTSSLVTAPDFGHWNALPENLPFEFVKLLDAVGFGATSPGQCWVSESCFEARRVLERFVEPALAKRPNLKVLLNTVIKDVVVDPVDGLINAVDVIRRTPRSSSSPTPEVHLSDSIQTTPRSSDRNSNWRRLRGVENNKRERQPKLPVYHDASSTVSADGTGAVTPAAASFASVLSDWYDAVDSAAFTKERFRLVRGIGGAGVGEKGAYLDVGGSSKRLVVIDGSELGDVLVLSSSFGGGWTQGYDDDEPTPAGNNADGVKDDDDYYYYAFGGNQMADSDVTGVVDACGEAVVFPHYLELLDPTSQRAQILPPTVWGPIGIGADNYSLGNFSLAEVWTYRRARTDHVPARADQRDDGQGRTDMTAGAAARETLGSQVGSQVGGPAAVGDVSLTAWGAGKGDGNDYPFG